MKRIGVGILDEERKVSLKLSFVSNALNKTALLGIILLFHKGIC